jgi:putative membrane protein
MIRNIIYGIIVGIINIIPGISGGMALVFLGIFDKTMGSISNVVHIRNIKSKKKDLIFLFQLGIGLVIGLIGFAKIIEYLLNYYPTPTMYWFIGLIFFSSPTIIKKEMKKEKFSIIYFIMGLTIISILFFLSLKTKSINVDPSNYPIVTFSNMIWMIIYGIIGGFVTIIPGASGSIVLLILGKYQLIESYLAHVMSLHLNIVIPTFFFGLGALIGIVTGAKVVTYFITKYRSYSMSLILGLIVMSVIVLIPINVTYDLKTIISSLITFLFGGLMILGPQIYENKKVQK